jgi:hypothetical protein
VSFSAIALCVVSQRVFIFVVYFVIDSVRKLLDTPSYVCVCVYFWKYRLAYHKITTHNNMYIFHDGEDSRGGPVGCKAV